MNNAAIADQLSLLAKLMDIHGENSFKAKSYASAAFALEKLSTPVASLPPEKISTLSGIGESTGRKILELVQTGALPALQQLLAQTPEGVLHMMNIKGLGPKKIHTLWKELHISSIDALQHACETNRVAEKKGFGEKTQQKILDDIYFQQQNSGKYLYAQVAAFAVAFTEKLKEAFSDQQVAITGAYRRQLEIIDHLEWVVTISKDELLRYLKHQNLQLVAAETPLIIAATEELLHLHFHCTDAAGFHQCLFATSCSAAFYEAYQQLPKTSVPGPVTNEAALFEAAGLTYLPPYRRETKEDLQRPATAERVIETHEIKGLIHAHSNWSDGASSIADMARALMEKGFEYLVLSDHSKAAYYANGLSEERIRQQHREITALNESLAPFKIYKSIECDILSDGSLDYSDAVLQTFDLVIASIHSNLDMEEEKAMQRLLGAINNPYVTMLGHVTGRRLLRRKGYPINHKTIIDACAKQQVVIEINASPERLDLDWRWIAYALEKGVLLSINPDAHSLDDFQNIHYGVLAAQKGGLTAAQNVSSFGRAEFEQFLQRLRYNKGLPL